MKGSITTHSDFTALGNLRPGIKGKQKDGKDTQDGFDKVLQLSSIIFKHQRRRVLMVFSNYYCKEVGDARSSWCAAIPHVLFSKLDIV